MLVLKFGGSSVGTPECIKNVAKIVTEKLGSTGPGVVVVSAFSGVTDALLSICDLATQRNASWNEELAKLVERHLNAARESLPVSNQSAALAFVKSTCHELEDLLRGVELLREASLRTKDLVLSFGERLSAYLVSRALASQGLATEYVDARDVLISSAEFGNARVNSELSLHRVREVLGKPGAVYVVTGFIGATERGETVTFGRGGSDYTASIIAELLNATEIQIWTDVDGFLTADPRKVSQAMPLTELSFEEAMELCHFGAKVIYPPTLQPASRKKIPIAVLNTFNPSFAGTRILYSGVKHPRPITGVTSVPKVALLRLEGNGLIGVSGVSMRLFSALANIKANVILITQASSEQSISVAISPKDASRARVAIVKEFNSEMKDGSVKPLIIEDELSIVSVVGENMRHAPGIAGTVFSALGRQGVNIVAIAQGSSELSISVVVSSRDESKALQSIHDAFFLSETVTAHIALIGPGLIGKTLLAQLSSHSQELRRSLSLELQLVAVADSKKMLLKKDGISIEQAYSDLSKNGTSYSLQTFADQFSMLNLPSSVLVDCSASENVAALYHDFISRSISVVTPNKRAQSGTYASYQQLKSLSNKKRVPWLFETSVGAGLPVISTLSDLIKSGDKIQSIEGVLSGTLSYIFSNFSSQFKFSELVLKARKAGYTEPDPREDLNGQDVGRKILILAREAGLTFELDQVSIENLVPEDLREIRTGEEFLQKLPDYDSIFHQRVLAAEKNNKKLRYIAVCELGEQPNLGVSLQEVGVDSPFWSLDGTDNMVSFSTERYSKRPLVVRGPGAGAEVTAAGVFADIIRAVI